MSNPYRTHLLTGFLVCLFVNTSYAAAPDDIATANVRAWFDALDTQAQGYSSTAEVPIYPGKLGTGISATNVTNWRSKVNGHVALSTYFASSIPASTAPTTSIGYPGIGARYDSANDSLAVQGDIWGANGTVVTTPDIFIVTSPTAPTSTTFLFNSQRGRVNTTQRISAHFPWSDGNIYWDPICCANQPGQIRSAAYSPSLDNLLITNWFANATNRIVIANGTSTLLVGSPAGTYTNLTTPAAPSYYTLGGGEANNSYRGVISENIVYNRLLLEAERRILNNYFAAKWGMGIAGEKRYQGDTAGNGLYRYHVGGIGSEASGNQASATSEGLTISNGNFLSAGRYLIAGLPGLSAAGTMTAYNQSIAGTTAKVVTAPQLLRGSVTTDLPATAWWRGARVWYVDKTDATNATGTVNLTFDITGKMGITTPNVDPLPASAVAAGDVLQLLFRSATTGNFSTVITAAASSAASVTFAVPANLLQDGYYTIGNFKPPKPSLSKTALLVSDPVNGTSNPKNIPGGVIEYTVSLSNVGESPLEAGTSNGVVLTDTIPSNLDMNPAVTINCTDNGVAMTLAATNVTYYSDAGATASITPTAGFDPLIRAIKIFPQGALRCPSTSPKCLLSAPPPAPTCNFKFQLRIK
jgi:uncharacterized repeat protein (TIGR01451 family)